MTSEIISSVLIGLITGAITSYCVSRLFYRFGRMDARASEFNTIASFLVLRLREMTPTSKERVEFGYGLLDTAHWMTCVSELLEDTGFIKESCVIQSVASDIQNAPHFALPNDKQKEEGEAAKKVWIRRIQELRK